MPASLPGATPAQNDTNPTQGRPIIMDALSGPKGSYLEARNINSWNYATGMPVYVKNLGNLTTGALCTGIGFGHNVVIGPVAPASIKDASFTDNYFPGRSAPDASNPTPATYAYIGGGRSDANAAGIAPTNPFSASQAAICGAGNGASRDAGDGVGFCMKMVTATATVAAGAEIETAFTNRTGVSLVSGQSAFGSALNANVPVT